MKYANVQRALFWQRPNRFIAICELEGETVTAHVRNTGRCRELLVPGCTVYLEEDLRPDRKTRYTLISVEKPGRMINMDSLAPNKVFREAIEKRSLQLPGLEGPYTVLKSETRYGDSRFDFYIENGSQKAFVEVKGVTLEEDGIVLFPDAPTQRGVKHIYELCRAAAENYLAFLVFIIQMKNVRFLTPNWRTHSAFGKAMKDAQESSVTLLAFDCHVTPNEICLDE
ncbi:MAG: DNA/RNA nuclease SfsA, partial [Clostridia bacterium]|nr:DNA/RNA nuclease SfsA [Clostridia bacterium]